MKRNAAREYLRRYRMMFFEQGWPPPSLAAMVALFRREVTR